MIKKISGLCMGLVLSMSLYGCIPLIVGAAAGAGTAVWLSNKLVHEVNEPNEEVLKATKRALDALDMPVVSETIKKDVAQVISRYSNGDKVWVDIRPTSEQRSQIQIRVGLTGGEEESRKILDEILRYL